MFCPLFSLPNPEEGLTSDRSVAGLETAKNHFRSARNAESSPKWKKMCPVREPSG